MATMWSYVIPGQNGLFTSLIHHGPTANSAYNNPFASSGVSHERHTEVSRCVSPQMGQTSILCLVMFFRIIVLVTTVILLMTTLTALGCSDRYMAVNPNVVIRNLQLLRWWAQRGFAGMISGLRSLKSVVKPPCTILS